MILGKVNFALIDNYDPILESLAVKEEVDQAGVVREPLSANLAPLDFRV